METVLVTVSEIRSEAFRKVSNALGRFFWGGGKLSVVLFETGEIIDKAVPGGHGVLFVHEIASVEHFVGPERSLPAITVCSRRSPRFLAATIRAKPLHPPSAAR